MAVAGGDVASLILPQADLDEVAFQRLAERVVPMMQERGIAVMIAGDRRIAARVKADGVHVDAGKAELIELVERLGPKMMIGAGGAKSRHDALELGEARPDYVFFGRIGYDNQPDAHPRNIALGRWWAEIVEIPCVVLAGSQLASVSQVAATGAEFVALSAAVFSQESDPRRIVEWANAELDRTAPRLGGR